MIDLLAREYGWSISAIMDLPMVVGFQLAHAISNRYASMTDGPQVVFNPKVDALKAEYLQKINQMNGNN